MFASLTSQTARILRRAAANLKAFALLEDPPATVATAHPRGAPAEGHRSPARAAPSSAAALQHSAGLTAASPARGAAGVVDHRAGLAAAIRAPSAGVPATPLPGLRRRLRAADPPRRPGSPARLPQPCRSPIRATPAPPAPVHRAQSGGHRIVDHCTTAR